MADGPIRSSRLNSGYVSVTPGLAPRTVSSGPESRPAPDERGGHAVEAERGAEAGPAGLAQATTGAVGGAVTRASDGAAVAGATVKALQAGVIKGTASSNADGTYSVAGLSAGTYDVQVSAPGYETQTRTGVTVNEQATTTADFSLGASGIQYVYDELGRLIAVIDPAGEVTRYEYDAVGNVQSISRQPNAPVSVIAFTPKRGLAGAVVTIYGTGFSSTPGQNSVNFNGVAATVTSASATRIVTAVPAGATTGPINVTTPAGSASGAAPFTVAASGPVVAGFDPTVGAAGTSVSVAGSDFHPAPSGNRLTLNGRRMTASAATATSITTTVPAGGTSGRISVSTAAGTGTSGNYFFVPPSPYTATDVEMTGLMSVGGSKAVTIATANKVGLVVFEGTTGQRVSLRVTNSTMGTTVVNIYNPDGTSLGSVSAGTSGGFIDKRTLPADGTYTILINPQGTNTGSLTLNLYNIVETTTAITPGGPAVTVTTTTPGENAKLAFNGAAGQRVSLRVDNSTYGALNSRVYLYNPDGTLLASSADVSTGDFIDTKTLAAAGVYTILVDPDSSYTGSMTLTLYDVPADAATAVTPGGPAATVTTTVPGQNARFTFTGTTGQRVSLRVNTSTYGASNSRLYVYNPDGTLLASDTAVVAGDFIDTNSLQADGTYTIVVDPEIHYVGSLALTLYEVPTDVTGSITPGGPAVTVTTTVAGQNARLTFSGTAGQRVSLKIENSTYGASNSRVYVYNPDGTLFASDTAVVTGDFIDARTLAADGTYTILIDPELNYVGSMTLRLYDVVDATGSITPGGPAVTITTTVPGQNARLTFSGTTGQRISLKVDNSTYGTSNSQVHIYNPDGTLLASDASVSTGDFIDARTLAAAGVYTILIDPDGLFTGSMTLSLYDVVDTSGSITPGGPAVTVALPTPGQTGRLTFNGTAGQRVSLRMTGVTISSSSVSVIKPDGTNLVTPTTVNTSGNFFDTKVLPADGTYTILIDPASSHTGSMTLTLYDVPADVTGSASVGGAAVTVTASVPGQNALLTFEGTAGQLVSLRMTGVTIAGTTTLTIRKPDGTNLVSGTTTTSGGYIDAQTLPVAGTYSILVDPATFNTGSITLTLHDANEIAGSITPGGPAVTVTTTVAGQNARLTFSGTAGQRVSLRVNTSTYGSSNSRVYIYNPDGTLLASDTSVSTGDFIDARTLAAAGVYTILVDPEGSYTGSMTLTLYDVPADVSTSITPGGAAVTVTASVPGQNALLTFEGTAGQFVSLRTTGVTVGGTTSVLIRKPDGTNLASGTFTTSGGYIDRQTLPVAGTYSILVDPATFNTGSVTLTLNDVVDATGSITPGGPAVTVTTTVAGQNARLTFSGTAGQRVSLRVNTSTYGASNSRVYVYNPDGTLLASDTSVSTGDFIDARTLAAAGVYTILVDPEGSFTGSMTLTLYDVPADVTGSASVGGAAVTVTASVPGQNALLTFEGTAGQQVTVRITGNTISSTAVKLLKPDGASLTSSTSSSSSFNLTTQTLPATGVYTISIDPAVANVGSMNVTLTNP